MERADFSGSRGDEEGWGRYGVKKRNAKGQLLVGFSEKDGNPCGEYFLQEEQGTLADV